MSLVLLARFAMTRTGLLIIAAVAVFIFYEGLPAPQFLKDMPIIGVVVQDLTDGRVDRAARQAREGYVLESAKLAAEFKAAELQRQVDAGNLALDLYSKKLQKLRASESALSDKLEKKISDYENQLDDEKRKCRALDQSAIDFLR